MLYADNTWCIPHQFSCVRLNTGQRQCGVRVQWLGALFEYIPRSVTKWSGTTVRRRPTVNCFKGSTGIPLWWACRNIWIHVVLKGGFIHIKYLLITIIYLIYKIYSYLSFVCHQCQCKIYFIIVEFCQLVIVNAHYA